MQTPAREPDGPATPEPVRVRWSLPHHRPLCTYGLLAIILLVWIAMTIAGGSENTMVVLAFGAKLNALIVAGQYWRLLTACFLHIGPLHLAFNACSLYTLGSEVESLFGSARFIAIFLLTGVAGNVLSFVGHDVLSAGASGAIFGLAGALIAYLVRYRHAFGAAGRRQLTRLLMIAALNLVLGMSPGIDNLAHLGGLLVGLGLGWAYCPRYAPRMGPEGPELADQWHPAVALAATLGVVAILVGATYLGVRWQA